MKNIVKNIMKSVMKNKFNLDQVVTILVIVGLIVTAIVKGV